MSDEFDSNDWSVPLDGRNDFTPPPPPPWDDPRGPLAPRVGTETTRGASGPPVCPVAGASGADRPRTGTGDHPRGADGRDFLVTHPRFRDWLHRCGLTSAAAVASLSGEVVSGHADRHVLRVELDSGSSRRTAYLKREHVVGRRVRWRNRRAGFGAVSRCEREAVTLGRLEAARLPGPQWLAYGQDAAGRGFLLVDELIGSVELREYLTEYNLSADDRRLVCERVGRAIAELHGTGFGTPELAAKHLFVQPGVLAVSLLDWQSTPPPGTVARADQLRWFGALHATLADDLASPRDRLRVVWAYRRTLRMIRAKGGAAPEVGRFGEFVQGVIGIARAVADKSSVRLQRQPVAPDVQQRLVWLAGEAVVTVPEVASVWPSEPISEPFYPAVPTSTPPTGHRERVTFADGRCGVLVRFHTADPIGRLLAAVRERPWRSPGSAAARILFHLQRHDIPAPNLLAFGQRTISHTVGESFVVGELPSHASALTHFLADSNTSAADRRFTLHECGRLLRKLHDARCRPAAAVDPNDPLFVVAGLTAGVMIGSPFAVRLVRRVTASDRRRDLKQFAATLGRADRVRVLRGYAATDTAGWKPLAGVV